MAATPTPLVNGIAYAWAQATFNVLGLPIFGISGLEYEEDQEIEDNMGAGNYAVSRGFGGVKFKSKITLHMEEVEAITNKAPGRRLQNIPEFDIVVSFLNTGGTTVTHKLRNCRFKGNKRTLKTGDTKIEVELDLAVGMIEW